MALLATLRGLEFTMGVSMLVSGHVAIGNLEVHREVVTSPRWSRKWMLAQLKLALSAATTLFGLLYALQALLPSDTRRQLMRDAYEL